MHIANLCPVRLIAILRFYWLLRIDGGETDRRHLTCFFLTNVPASGILLVLLMETTLCMQYLYNVPRNLSGMLQY